MASMIRLDGQGETQRSIRIGAMPRTVENLMVLEFPSDFGDTFKMILSASEALDLLGRIHNGLTQLAK